MNNRNYWIVDSYGPFSDLLSEYFVDSGISEDKINVIDSYEATKTLLSLDKEGHVVFSDVDVFDKKGFRKPTSGLLRKLSQKGVSVVLHTAFSQGELSKDFLDLIDTKGVKYIQKSSRNFSHSEEDSNDFIFSSI